MTAIHRKSFADRYTMLHEQQVLDYLNQRHAPVPQVIISHLEQSYLEMSHGGTDLQAWIHETQPPHSELSRALSLAIQAAMQVAELGVWHVDIALRNFVIHDVQNGQHPTVWLIDFANTISDQFPLQKPLWMLPAAHQHSQLQQCLTLDWQAFYARHQLPQPDNWHQVFDVPMSLYREDWTTDLHVERIPNRWCLLAHGIGQMGLQLQKDIGFSPDHRQIGWAQLLNLDNETLAKRRLEQCLLQSGVLPGSDQSTPRPRATVSTGPSPEPPSQAPETRKAAGPTSTGRTGRSFHWVTLGLNLLFISLGWLLIDAVYTRYGIVLSWLSWLAILGAMVGSGVSLICALASRHPRPWWALALLVQPITQSWLCLESWVLHIPTFALTTIGGCLAISTALTLIWARQKP
jgi:hypothetical protein